MKLKRIILAFTALFISLQISAQDLIYKKNGEIVKAKILNTTDKSLSYKNLEQSDNITNFINISVIDSIIYQDGKKETFTNKITPAVVQAYEPDTKYRHHLIGADLTALLFARNLIISYEYLPAKAKIGFKAAFAKNFDPRTDYNYDGNTYPGYSFAYGRITKWSTRIGMNYYIFPPRTFRFGTGIYYLFGSYTSEKTIYNNDYTSSTLVTENKNIQGVLLSIFGFYNLTENVAFNFGFDAPLHLNPTSKNYVVRCEILLNF